MTAKDEAQEILKQIKPYAYLVDDAALVSCKKFHELHVAIEAALSTRDRQLAIARSCMNEILEDPDSADFLVKEALAEMDEVKV